MNERESLWEGSNRDLLVTHYVPRTPVDSLLSDLSSMFGYPPNEYMTRESFDDRVEQFKREIEAPQPWEEPDA